MSTTAENSIPEDALVARAAVIASNDPTSHGDALAIVTATVAPLSPGSTEMPVTVGRVLREAREKLGLSPGDIANRLRMGIKQVIALENSDYASVPTGTFLRGFVRNYAKAVALNAGEVVALLESTHGNAVAVKASQVVVPSRQNIQVPMPGGKLALPNIRHFGVGIVVLCLLAVAWYWWEHVLPYRNEGGRAKTAETAISIAPVTVSPAISLSLPVAPTADATAQAPVTDTPVTATTTDIASVGTASSASVTHVVSSVESVPAPASMAPALVTTATARETETVRERKESPVAGGAALGFTFSGESWVEVFDGAGKRVLSRRFKAGDAEEVLGRAPFTVVIGNASSTRMAFNGREYDLDPHTRGAVARVTVK